MLEAALDARQLETFIMGFATALARLSFLVFFMPGLGEQTISLQFRVLTLISLAAAVVATGAVAAPSQPSASAFIALIAGEVAIGFFLGATLRIAIWALSSAGTVIAQSIGLSQFLGVALEQDAQTITANLLSLAGATLLISLNYHVHAFAAHIRFYEEAPIGDVLGLDPAHFAHVTMAAFSHALLIAWPFVLVSLLYNVCLGFLNRALPQLMVAFVGAPLMVGGGLFMLAVSVGALLAVWLTQINQYTQWF